MLNGHLFSSYDNVRATTNCASWISDGPWLTTHQAYLDFVYRASGELLYYLTNQVPEKLKFKLDFDVLRQAMSLEDESETRIFPNEWDLHPGSMHTSPEFGCTRAQSVALWEQHKQKHALFYPYVVDKKRRTGDVFLSDYYMLCSFYLTLQGRRRLPMLQTQTKMVMVLGQVKVSSCVILMFVATLTFI